MDLRRFKTNVGVDEQEMRRLSCVLELADQCVAAAGYKRIVPEQGERGVEIGLRRELDEADDRLHIMLRNKPPEVGRGNKNHWPAWSFGHANPWKAVLWQRKRSGSLNEAGISRLSTNRPDRRCIDGLSGQRG